MALYGKFFRLLIPSDLAITSSLYLRTARLSILFSVIRITPPGSPKRILYGLVGSFVVVWIILFSQVFWVCENQPLWKVGSSSSISTNLSHAFLSGCPFSSVCTRTKCCNCTTHQCARFSVPSITTANLGLDQPTFMPTQF